MSPVSRVPARFGNLKSVRRTGIKQQVFEQLRNDIVRGTWPPGNRLPSENELGVKFGCSRISVREALHMLASLGLVEMRHGDGTFVADRVPSGQMRAQRELLRQQIARAAELAKTLGVEAEELHNLLDEMFL